LRVKQQVLSRAWQFNSGFLSGLKVNYDFARLSDTQGEVKPRLRKQSQQRLQVRIHPKT
jgi:hypothetical protein